MARVSSNTIKSHPAWSPDSKEIAFYETPLKACASYPHPHYAPEKIPDVKGYAVCVLNVESGNARVAGPAGYGITEERHFPPAWSPDGKQIAFEATYRRMWGPGWKERWADPKKRILPCIHLVNLDGTGLRKLSGEGSRDSCPVWYRDGSRIAYVSDRAGREQSGIYLMNADGTAPQKIPADTMGAERILWSPDGKWIAFTSHQLAPGKSKRYFSLFVTTPAGDILIPVCPEIPVDNFSSFCWASLPD